MSFFSSCLALIAVTFNFFDIASATFDATANNNLVLYWGQNSAGSQESLASYCESGSVDVILLSFVMGFTDTPALDFSNACSETYSNGVLKCDQIASDIATCQSAGKKVLLSLGGAIGDYGFTSDDEGTAFATTLWNLFGEGSSDFRPFGNSIVDGFDLDIENKDQTGYVAMVSKLRNYFDASTTKTYYISAAPQCVYPDESVGDVLANSYVDFVYIQFYNNYCNVDKQFNWDTWSSYASSVSKNSNVRIYLGLPGSTSAAGSGYIGIDSVITALGEIASDSHFGGVSIWDASQAFSNVINGNTFASLVKDALGGSSSVSAASVIGAVDASSSAETSETCTGAISSAASSAASATTDGNAQKTEVTTQDAVESTAALTTTLSLSLLNKAAESTSLDSTSSTITLAYSASSTSSTSLASTNSAIISSSATPTLASSSRGHSHRSAVSSVTGGIQVQTTPTIDSYSQITSNTFSISSATLSTVVISGASSASSSTQKPASSSSTATLNDSYDCASLSGDDEVSCLNSLYEAGEYNGSKSNCTDGAIACASDGSIAICNYGSWVNTACADGTTCYAYISNNQVETSCNFSS